MIVDTHVHYLQPPSAERPHDPHGNTHEILSVETIIAQATAIGIDRILQISATTMGYDNRYGLEGASLYPDRVAGVIGRFDPFAPDIEGRLRAFLAQKHMLGVRIQLNLSGPSEAWLRDRTLDPFFTVAEKLDALIGIIAMNQPGELRKAAQRFPGLRMIAEHCTLCPADTQEKTYEHWPDILALATEPNVWMKVSRFPEMAPKTERYPFPSQLPRLRELYEHAGPARLIWGSNYPPVAKTCTYREALDFVRVAADFIPERDRNAILGGNFIAAFAS